MDLPVAQPRDPSERGFGAAPMPSQSENIVGAPKYELIPGGPRAQSINGLTAKVSAGAWINSPYEDGKCYAAYSHSQMLRGAVCADEENANWARGGHHSTKYSPEHLYERRMHAFSANAPSNTGLLDQRIVSKIPMPNNQDILSNKYQTYPYFANYTSDGMLYYQYPYAT